MKSEACEQVVGALLAAVTPGGGAAELDPSGAAHLADCERCARLRESIETTRLGLDDWKVDPPPSDLVARTLDAALAAAVVSAPHEETSDDAANAVADGRTVATSAPPESKPSGYVAVPAPSETLRILTAPIGVGDDGVPVARPARAGILARLAAQVVAAAFMFILCGTFTVYFYPAFTEALDARRASRCQSKLERLRHELLTHLSAHPELDGRPIKEVIEAMLADGVLDTADLVCPGAASPTARSYYISTAAFGTIDDTPVLWDKFGNHEEQVNVLFSSGRIDLIDGETFVFRLSRDAANERTSD